DGKEGESQRCRPVDQEPEPPQRVEAGLDIHLTAQVQTLHQFIEYGLLRRISHRGKATEVTSRSNSPRRAVEQPSTAQERQTNAFIKHFPEAAFRRFRAVDAIGEASREKFDQRAMFGQSW